MYQEIKQMAEEALKLQNKNFMDETLNKIVALCESALISEAIDATVTVTETEIRVDTPSAEFPFALASDGSAHDGDMPKDDFSAQDAAVEAGSPAVDEAALGVQGAPHDPNAVGEFSTGIGAIMQSETDRRNAEILANMDTMLGEITPGPQAVLKRAKKGGILDLDSACRNLANTAIKHADEQSQATKKEGAK